MYAVIIQPGERLLHGGAVFYPENRGHDFLGECVNE
jgi:hypothetical protein